MVKTLRRKAKPLAKQSFYEDAEMRYRVTETTSHWTGSQMQTGVDTYIVYKPQYRNIRFAAIPKWDPDWFRIALPWVIFKLSFRGNVNNSSLRSYNVEQLMAIKNPFAIDINKYFIDGHPDNDPEIFFPTFLPNSSGYDGSLCTNAFYELEFKDVDDFKENGFVKISKALGKYWSEPFNTDMSPTYGDYNHVWGAPSYEWYEDGYIDDGHDFYDLGTEEVLRCFLNPDYTLDEVLSTKSAYYKYGDELDDWGSWQRILGPLLDKL